MVFVGAGSDPFDVITNAVKYVSLIKLFNYDVMVYDKDLNRFSS